MGKPLTHQYLLHVLNYDPATGSFSWRVDIPKRIKAGMTAGSPVDGKRLIGLNGSNHYCHRLAWFYVNGEMPSGYVVPINGDFLDCRIENLKLETPSDTLRRSSVRFTSTSGVKGVSWNTKRKKWVASVHVNLRQLNLGYFNTIEEAAHACEEARKNAPPVPSQGEILAKREAIRLVARQRRAWKRAVDENGNSAWPDFAAFAADIGSVPKNGSCLVPLDASRPVGPDNYSWERPQRHDKKTAEGRRAYSSESRLKNYDRERARGLRRSFGLELHEYEEMFKKQGGVCAICHEPERGMRGGYPISMAVDHDHETGAIRGLLCRGCNQGVGNFNEDPDRLKKAAAYLEFHATGLSLVGPRGNLKGML